METVTKFLILGIVILVLSVGTYYFIDRDELQQEPIIEIGTEPDIVKNRLTHDEMRDIDDLKKLDDEMQKTNQENEPYDY